MKAGKQFVDDLVEKGLLDNVTRVAVDVYGSLSLTGKGHHTDIAIIMGLAGNEPATVDIDSIPVLFATSKRASVCYWPGDVTKSTSRKMTECVFSQRQFAAA